ncbi:hypothetical protein CVIRNUC_006174 [Coccomyxa viridis]|uniref:Serine/threonine-protein phosphatase 2A activator n=1 Tax=Coccomyxa viridis TaxID=1274662 RepID=A0AAV1I7B7_9CHLO|nr:hypothetical protein CVIRNUC_006174 [Coccomyxa viridis]
MQPEHEGWGDQRDRKLPMEPTRAPWAREGPNHLDVQPPRLSASSDMAVDTAAPAASSHHHRERGYLTGQPVDSVVVAEASLPMPLAASGRQGTSFQPPKKRIHSQADLDRFLRSDAVREFVGFIHALNDAVKGRSNGEACTMSPPVEALVTALQQMSAWVDDIPPQQQSLRYGNPAYRVWFAKVAEAGEGLIRSVLPSDLHMAAVELAPYLIDSIGNSTRIDYGTGHETTFCALLCCLAKLGVLTNDDLQALVTRVFLQYIELMRKVQTTYWLEPAGSHGVWGLDDYHFLPFVWGSAQLIDHPYIRPRSIHNKEILDTCSEDFMYLSCVRFVKQVKKGPLAETSPMLNDISGVPTWTKVNTGMMKMYQVEVLSKVPIMQHFLFGSLLSFE